MIYCHAFLHFTPDITRGATGQKGITADIACHVEFVAGVS